MKRMTWYGSFQSAVGLAHAHGGKVIMCWEDYNISLLAVTVVKFIAYLSTPVPPPQSTGVPPVSAVRAGFLRCRPLRLPPLHGRGQAQRQLRVLHSERCYPSPSLRHRVPF